MISSDLRDAIQRHNEDPLSVSKTVLDRIANLSAFVTVCCIGDTARDVLKYAQSVSDTLDVAGRSKINLWILRMRIELLSEALKSIKALIDRYEHEVGL